MTQFGETKLQRKVTVCNTVQQFEELVNREDIDIIQMDAKGCEQSYTFQESFIGVVVYDIKMKDIEVIGSIHENKN